MTDYAISQLAALTAPEGGDLLPVVDVSDTTTPPAGSAGSDKHMTLSVMLTWIQANFTLGELTSLATTHNTLDDGDGNMSIAGTALISGALTADGVIAAKAGTDTSGTAADSTPSLSSGTPAQINATQDVMLYCRIKTASTFSLAMGPTSSAADTIAISESSTAIGVVSVRVPKGWYVVSTFTSADVVWSAVTC